MKILIADDHGLFREGLRFVLQQLDAGIQIIEAADFSETLHKARQEVGLHVILLDLVMPGMTWQEGLTRLRESLPDVPVVILSASEDRPLVMQAVKLGAAGFIPKSSNSKIMLGAVRLVLSGGVYLPPALLERNVFQKTNGGAEDGEDSDVAAPGATHVLLTPRQREVLGLVGEGKSNKEIARLLDLSEGTVKLHVTAILKALKVNNRTRAVVAASQLGLTSLPRAGQVRIGSKL
ncbi:MAG: response regulator [Rhodospirillaceae bacterium]|nr:MAG: response regulator [Rhodospirillaceae bacterium]